VFNKPIAYFTTYHTYGTWLHGAAKGSVDPSHNQYGQPFIPPSVSTVSRDQDNLEHEPLVLAADQRRCVEATIRAVCEFKGWFLQAVNVRTNHVHLVVSADETPERVMNTLKSWSTRRLVEANLLDHGRKAWSRHGSTRYLWNKDQLAQAFHYTLHEQGPPLSPSETRPSGSVNDHQHP
jgi:REP element-mobilizing transposase RayT